MTSWIAIAGRIAQDELALFCIAANAMTFQTGLHRDFRPDFVCKIVRCNKARRRIMRAIRAWSSCIDSVRA